MLPDSGANLAVHELAPAEDTQDSIYPHYIRPIVSERICSADSFCSDFTEPREGWREGHHYVDPYLVERDSGELQLGVEFICGASPTRSMCREVGDDQLECDGANPDSLCADSTWRQADAVVTDHCVRAVGLASWDIGGGDWIEIWVGFVAEF